MRKKYVAEMSVNGGIGFFFKRKRKFWNGKICILILKKVRNIFIWACLRHKDMLRKFKSSTEKKNSLGLLKGFRIFLLFFLYQNRKFFRPFWIFWYANRNIINKISNFFSVSAKNRLPYWLTELSSALSVIPVCV